MMRNIAIGLAAATIVIGDSTLSASAGQESGIGKGSTGSVKSHHTGPRTYNQERARRDRFAKLTPAHASVSGRSRANATATSPRANASNLQQIGRELYAEPTRAYQGDHARTPR